MPESNTMFVQSKPEKKPLQEQYKIVIRQYHILRYTASAHIMAFPILLCSDQVMTPLILNLRAFLVYVPSKGQNFLGVVTLKLQLKHELIVNQSIIKCNLMENKGHLNKQEIVSACCILLYLLSFSQKSPFSIF